MGRYLIFFVFNADPNLLDPNLYPFPLASSLPLHPPPPIPPSPPSLRAIWYFFGLRPLPPCCHSGWLLAYCPPPLWLSITRCFTPPCIKRDDREGAGKMICIDRQGSRVHGWVRSNAQTVTVLLLATTYACNMHVHICMQPPHAQYIHQ